MGVALGVGVGVALGEAVGVAVAVGVDVGVVAACAQSPAGVEINVGLLVIPTPDDHIAAGPDCSVIPSCQRRVCGTCRRPAVRGDVISPACLKIDCRAAKNPTPNDHLAAGPYRRVRVSRRGRIVEAGGDPTVRARIVSAAGICIVGGFIHAAPDNHFVAAPHPCVDGSAKRHVGKAL
jgi:hypothetical protein